MLFSNLYVYIRNIDGSLATFLLVDKSDTSLLPLQSLYLSIFCFVFILCITVLPVIQLSIFKYKTQLSLIKNIISNNLLRVLVLILFSFSAYVYIKTSLADRSYLAYLAGRQVTESGNITRVLISYLNSALFLLPLPLAFSRTSVNYNFLILVSLITALLGSRSTVLIVFLIALTVQYNQNLSGYPFKLKINRIRLKISNLKAILIPVVALLIVVFLTLARSNANTGNYTMSVIDSVVISQGRSLQSILGLEYLRDNCFDFSMLNIFLTGLTPALKHIFFNYPELSSIGSLIGKELQSGWITNSSFLLASRGDATSNISLFAVYFVLFCSIYFIDYHCY